MKPSQDCVFCQIVTGRAPAQLVAEGKYTTVFVPLNPHAPGHVLVVPNVHLTDANYTDHPYWRYTFEAAAAYGAKLGRPYNLLTSVGAEATQTVLHLHLHVIPRGSGDGLDRDWPWMRSG